MPEFRVKLRRSSTSGSVPSVSDLELGELAVNTYDGKIFTKKDDGQQSIVEVGVGTDLTWTASTRTIASSSGTNAVITNATTSDSGLMSSSDKSKLDGIQSGAQVNVGTDLSYVNSTREVQSSTGTNATLPEVVAGGVSGFMTGSDKTKLDGIAAGAQVNVGTDLSYTSATRALASSTGTDVTLPLVSSGGSAGLMSGTDKTKLDSIQSNAEINVNADWNATSGDAQILNKPSIPQDLDDLSNVDTTTPTDGQVLAWDNTNSYWAPADASSGITDLSYTSSTRVISSSTGTDATLPEVTAAGDSGLMTGADKTKLDGIAAGAEVNVGTDLSYALLTRTLSSSTGADVSLPLATGSNDGLITSSNLTKLNGIETGATADQTAAEILTEIKTVDGSGSGLDADLLDGVEGSNYLRSNTSDTATGLLDLNGGVRFVTTNAGGNGISFVDNGYQTRWDGRETLTNQTVVHKFARQGYNTGNFVPYIENWYDGANYHSIGLNSSGVLEFNSNKIWHAGNDGAGSGLDADSLDGHQENIFMRRNANSDLVMNSQSLHFGASNTNSKIRWSGTTSLWDLISGDLKIRDGTTDRFTFARTTGNFTASGTITATSSITSYTSIAASTGMTVNSNTVWHAGNDGSGSGLDADTLDGQQGSYYLDYNNLTNVPSGGGGSSDLQGYEDYEALIDFGSDAAGTERRIISTSVATGTYQTIGFQIDVIDNLENHAPSYSAGNVKQATYYVTCARTDSTTTNSPDNVTIKGPQNLDHIRARKISTGNYEITLRNDAQWREYRIKVKVIGVNGNHIVAYSNGDTPSTATASYTKTISDTNIDYFQTVESGDINLTSGKDITLNGGAVLASGTGGNTGGVFGNIKVGYGALYNTVQTNDGTSNLYLQYSSTGGVYVGTSNVVWHAGNDGSGSGLDADLWDGNQFSSYLNQALLTSSGPTFANVYVNDWFRNNNAGEGLYNQNTTGHFYSASSSYWHIDSGNGLIFYSAYNSSAGNSTNRKGYIYHDSNGFGVLGSSGSWAINIPNGTASVIIGGHATNNAYNSVSSTRLGFGGGDDLNNYFIGTNMENYGGNYTKLDLRWHTGIRMGAQPTYGGVRIFNNEDLSTLLFSVGRGDGNTRVESGALYIGGNTTWHAGNDGSGSGLDADLVDGLHIHTGRNNQANRVVRTDGSGYIQAGWINTTSGTSADSKPSRWYSSHDAYLRYMSADNAKMWLGLTAKSTYARRDSTSDSNYFVGAMGWGTTDLNTVFHWGSGFWDTWSNPGNQPSGTSHWTGLNSLHYTNGSNLYGFQLTVGAGNTALMYVRGQWGGSPGSWTKVWNAANDGSGSGLDADTLDGIQGGNFLRSDTSDTMTGELNVTRNSGVTGSSAPTYSQVNIELQTSSNHVPAIGFHRGGYSATTLYEYDGQLYVNAWTTRAQTGLLISTGNIGQYAPSTTGATFTGNVKLNDNVKLLVGNDSDVQLYHDSGSSDSKCDINGNDFIFYSTANSEQFARFHYGQYTRAFVVGKTIRSNYTSNSNAVKFVVEGRADLDGIQIHGARHATASPYRVSAVGTSAITYASTSGTDNTACGYAALNRILDGYENTALGSYAGSDEEHGDFNVFIGGGCAEHADDETYRNVYIGYQAGYDNNFDDCVMIGYRSGYSQDYTNGNKNTYLGAFTAYSKRRGENNTLLGYQAGRYTQSGTDSSTSTYYSNTTCLGYDSRISGSNQVQLGNSSTTTYAYGSVQNRSDARDKTDIRPTLLGLEFIKKLKPVDFRWDYRDDYTEMIEREETKEVSIMIDNPDFVPGGDEPEQIKSFEERTEIIEEMVYREKDGSRARTRFHHGLIAQDVKEIMDEMGIDFAGYQDHSIKEGLDVLSIGYTELIAPMIRAIQEQQEQIQDLQDQINSLMV